MGQEPVAHGKDFNRLLVERRAGTPPEYSDQCQIYLYILFECSPELISVISSLPWSGCCAVIQMLTLVCANNNSELSAAVNSVWKWVSSSDCVYTATECVCNFQNNYGRHIKHLSDFYMCKYVPFNKTRSCKFKMWKYHLFVLKVRHEKCTIQKAHTCVDMS